MYEIFEELPDRRIELIDGQFIVGTNLEGSRRLLKVLLASWGGNAALSLTPTITDWVMALNLAYGFSYLPDAAIPVTELQAKQALPAQRKLVPKGEDDFLPLTLASDLHMALHPHRGVESFGRDFVTKLAQNALTPNGTICHQAKAALCSYYLDGPPDIAFEFAHDEVQLARHFEIYLRHGVSELWVFNVKTGQIHTYSFAFGEYAKEFDAAGGIISSTAIPGLHVEVMADWQHRQYGDEVFRVVAAPTQESRMRKSRNVGVKWDSLAFTPILELEPFPISFDEFVSWTGETKFESYDEGRVSVGTPAGTRPVFGQLLMTFGLVEAVKLMPPVFWMKAINERIAQLAQQETIRQTMWQTAQRAAQLLHDQFNVAKVAVVGDLVNEMPLGLWSRVTLLLPDEPRRHEYFMIYEALRNAVGNNVDTYYADDYLPLEIRNTVGKMALI